MQGKILIVDAIATNRIVLKVKLVTAFYEVVQATTLAEAVEMACTQSPDLIITALSLPDGTAAALRQRLRAEPAAKYIPVMAVGAQASAPDRLATLRAGVRDILTRPLDETLLLGRVRSLIRAHTATADWQMRDDTSHALGLAEPERPFADQSHCMLVSADRTLLQTYAMQMRPVVRMKLTLASVSTLTTELRNKTMPDVFVLILPADTNDAMDALRILSALTNMQWD